jgi:hypothetical protein
MDDKKKASLGKNERGSVSQRTAKNRMSTDIFPRRTRDHNATSTDLTDLAKQKTKPTCEQPGSLIDIHSPYFVSFVVLSSALKETMGGYPPSEEVAITNAIWRMVVENNIPFSVAKTFADEKKSCSRKRVFENKLVLDSWWAAMQYTVKNSFRRKPLYDR